MSTIHVHKNACYSSYSSHVKDSLHIATINILRDKFCRKNTRVTYCIVNYTALVNLLWPIFTLTLHLKLPLGHYFQTRSSGMTFSVFLYFALISVTSNLEYCVVSPSCTSYM